MISIRNTAALFLLFLALCTSIAMAQPPGPGSLGGKEFVTFVQVAEPAKAKVWLTLEGNKYVVTSNVSDVATLPWKADAACNSRLKTFSVKHPDGDSDTTTTPKMLANTAKGLHETLNLQSFPRELIRNRCLDIANVPEGGPFQTAVDAPEEREKDLAELGEQFNEGAAETFIDGAQHPNAFLLLTSQCSTTNGSHVTSQVIDKKFVPTISFLCCNSGVPSPACR